MSTTLTSIHEQEWRSNTLSERLAFVYKNKQFTDVAVCAYLCDKEYVFLAHKNILAAFSPVFEERLYRNDPQGLSHTTLEGIHPQGLAYVLNLLYYVPPSPRKDIDRSILISAYHAAKTLHMNQIETDLKREILGEILTSSLVTRDDFWKILDLSRILKLNDITERLLSFAESNSKEILRARSLTKVSPTTLKAVIDLDMLKVSERDVLDSIVWWKEGNKNLPFVDEFVQDLLTCVRFRNLSTLDLCQFVASKSDIISNDDILTIMMHQGNPTSMLLPAWCSMKFRLSLTSLSKVGQDEKSSKNENNKKAVSFKLTTGNHSPLLNLYLEKKYTDVCFLVGTERKAIKAHRNILAIGSIVFEKMFFSSVPDRRFVIDIPNQDPDAFDKMLMYYYDDSISDSLLKKRYEAFKVLKVAMKYGSMNLKSACWNFYTPVKFSAKNFWQKLGSIIKEPTKNCLDVKELLDYVSKDTKNVLSYPGFLDATPQAVKRFLKLDILSVKEIEVLNIVERWLDKNLKAKEEEISIYDLLSHIRFSSIPLEEFCSFSAEHGNLLKQEDVLSILMHLHNKEKPLPAWCYKGPPRQLSDVLFHTDDLRMKFFSKNKDILSTTEKKSSSDKNE